MDRRPARGRPARWPGTAAGDRRRPNESSGAEADLAFSSRLDADKTVERFGIYEPRSPPQVLLTFPEMIWELTFGLYLIVKGFASPARRRHPEPRAAAATAAALV
jgi:hypothetical protein